MNGLIKNKRYEVKSQSISKIKNLKELFVDSAFHFEDNCKRRFLGDVDGDVGFELFCVSFLFFFSNLIKFFVYRNDIN